ncbi:hypothetical protein CCS41_14845 (plasmid) [Candidatus Fukatsuia symbiotica]|uniref:Transposase zinc-binding domain-containing protein n=1 Tax=Candidatus Fukatsuia symbiotica TaxID=1878942 RepID=A0A2Y9CKK6_9GAMM|nr:hypothetical protein CCS41_14845 [Candidatus Fukatsuia symbiotica]
MLPRLRHVFQCGRAWWQFYETHADELRDVIVETMVKLFACGTSTLGYTIWRCACQGCDHTKRILFSCKSRSCPSCGKKATEQWAQKQETGHEGVQVIMSRDSPRPAQRYRLAQKPLTPIPC